MLLASLLGYYAGKRVADKWWKAHSVVGYNGEYWNPNKGTEPVPSPFFAPLWYCENSGNFETCTKAPPGDQQK